MPELPEVETVVRQLKPRMEGRRIDSVPRLRGVIVRSGFGQGRSMLEGRLVRRVRREGKRIVFELDPPGLMIVHLGMTGRLELGPAGPIRDRHTHLAIIMAPTGKTGVSSSVGAKRMKDEACPSGHWGSGTAPDLLRFRDARRFGGVWFVDGSIRPSELPLSPLGPDALDVSLGDFLDLLKRRRAIKALLLDQSILSGLGNIYSDESLYGAGIHPRLQAAKLSADEVSVLHQTMRGILHEAIQADGSTLHDYRTAEGRPGRFQERHGVYGKAGCPCPRCATSILRIVVAGRSTFYCPRCQPEFRDRCSRRRRRLRKTITGGPRTCSV